VYVNDVPSYYYCNVNEHGVRFDRD
jgi:hypothetical protein